MVKINELSYKKIKITYNTTVIFKNIPIDTIELSLIYNKKSKHIKGLDSIRRKLSKKYGIKTKYILILDNSSKFLDISLFDILIIYNDKTQNLIQKLRCKKINTLFK